MLQHEPAMLARSSLKIKLIYVPLLLLVPLTLILGTLFYTSEQEHRRAKVDAILNHLAFQIAHDLSLYFNARLNEGRLLARHPALLETIEDRDFESAIERLLISNDVMLNKTNILLADEAFSLASTAIGEREQLAVLRRALNQLTKNEPSAPVFQSFLMTHESERILVALIPVERQGKTLAWLGLVFNVSELIPELLQPVIAGSHLPEFMNVKVAIAQSERWIIGPPINSYRNTVTKELNLFNTKFDLTLFADDLAFFSSLSIERIAIYLCLFLLLLLLLIMQGWVVQRYFLSRIKKLRSAAAAFSSGDFDSRVAVTGSDEVSDLEAVFNSMCADVSQAHNYLKMMVDLRTRQADEYLGRLEATLHSVAEAIISIDESAHIVSFNLAAERIFGYLESEVIGKNIKILMPHNYSVRHDQFVKQALEKNQTNFLISDGGRQVQGKRKNGDLFPVQIRVTKGEYSGKAYFISAIEDLSEKLRAQRVLEKQQKLFETAIENASQPIVLVRPDGSFLKVNNAVCKWLGYSEAEMMTLSVEDITPENYLVSTRSAIQKIISGELESLTKEKQYRRKDGSLVWGLLSISTVKNEDGEIELMVSHILDIDETKRMSKTLEQRNIELESSNADLDQFAYLASHDLKSPLNAIKKIVSWIEEDAQGSLNQDLQQHFALLRNRADRMAKLLDDLLLYSRVGRVYEAPERVDFKQLVSSSFEILDGAENFRLLVAEGIINVPKIPLDLVIRNLLSNTIKHHDLGRGEINVALDYENGAYVISIRDDGPGIPPKMHGKVFEMLQTLKSRDTTEGSGMGLAVVKKMVEYYGGQVKIESDGVRGTTIKIYWPQSDQSEQG